jgi:spore coat polysaccharide biosynthesis predicted glycosyltransferase SpsG
MVRRIEAPAWSNADAQAVAALVQQFSARAVVTDSYLYDAAYLRALHHEEVALVAIDDLARLPAYPCDVLVNPNLAGEEKLYAGRAENARRLLGPRYVMLRREFSRHRTSVRSIGTVAKRLLVTFGGVDPKNGGALALKALALLPALEVDFVIGAGNIHGDDLTAKARALRHVRVVHDARDMAGLIMHSEMLLSAGGTTVWEAAALGAPMLLAAAAPEEASAAERLARGGLCVFLGAIESLTPATLAEAIGTFAADMAARARSSVLGRELVDGYGAERVVEEIRRVCAI